MLGLYTFTDIDLRIVARPNNAHCAFCARIRRLLGLLGDCWALRSAAFCCLARMLRLWTRGSAALPSVACRPSSGWSVVCCSVVDGCFGGLVGLVGYDFELAASRSNCFAQFCLGCCLESGLDFAGSQVDSDVVCWGCRCGNCMWSNG